MTDQQPSQEELNRTVILDPDFYDNQLMSTVGPDNIFRVLYGPISNPNLHLAFIRGTVAQWWTFVDFTQEHMAGVDKDGKRVDTLAAVKIFMLTEKGKQRKRLLALKFPKPINETPGLVQ